MLGLRRPHPEATVQPLSRAWTLVLVTDGLLEAPGTDLDDALEALRVAVAVDMPPEALCSRLLERFGSSRRDDVALLVLRGRP
jgi:serine phosphatase RsbU (regulator of sigma subunit)